ncbi:amino acid permease [Gorillibacterium timonense]|uniref:amino acid permease n=1 Tax=Gorillibacterium timonense TaxID=1689269 RepID=UPI00071D597C|nr:amino acid permease [Gorillibacterium timonense]
MNTAAVPAEQPVKRTIGLPQAIALYIGSVLGSGILVVPGLAAEIAGPASLLAWGFMAILILPMALSMGLLAARFPDAGGVSHFAEMAFGPKIGALTGWLFLASVPIGAPVAALTGAGYLTDALGLGEPYRVAVACVMLVVALGINAAGMKLVGGVQIAVVLAIIVVLAAGIAVSIPHLSREAFTPFLPNGWLSVGKATALLFWCFIGWEAVSHLSAEFKNPKKAGVQGVIVAALLLGVLYTLTAVATVGTASYHDGQAEASLSRVIGMGLGSAGGVATGVVAVLICTATIIAYSGAASRLAYSLAKRGEAPRMLGRLSRRSSTPLGGLAFLAACFAIVMTVYGKGIVSLSELIRFPNATFILTYISGTAAGIRLLKGNSWQVRICALSCFCSLAVFPFVGTAAWYPLLIAAGFSLASFLRNPKHAVDVPRVFQKEDPEDMHSHK